MDRVALSPVLTGIADAEDAMLAVIGAFIVLSAAMLGIALVYRFIKKRAGA